jgi:hypothetical protein
MMIGSMMAAIFQLLSFSQTIGTFGLSQVRDSLVMLTRLSCHSSISTIRHENPLLMLALMNPTGTRRILAGRCRRDSSLAADRTSQSFIASFSQGHLYPSGEPNCRIDAIRLEGASCSSQIADSRPGIVCKQPSALLHCRHLYLTRTVSSGRLHIDQRRGDVLSGQFDSLEKPALSVTEGAAGSAAVVLIPKMGAGGYRNDHGE